MFRKRKIESRLIEMAGKFLTQEYKPGVLVTITKAELSDDTNDGMLFFTVLPEKEEAEVLKYLQKKENEKEFRKFLKEKSGLGMLPRLSFKIDFGEKNRQRIDELISKE